jgi:hypothetical protein
MKHIAILLTLAFCWVAQAHAAGAAAPPENLVACSRMTEPGERLRCYDTQMAAMLGAASGVAPPAGSAAPNPALAVVPAPSAAATGTAAVPPPTPAPAAAAPPPPTAEEKFGAVDLPRPAREKMADPNKVLVSSIASIRQVRPKLWLIVLANGQIWLQDGTQITMFFRAGYEVRIEKGLMEGEFRMWTPQTGEKNGVKVSRVQ